MAADRRTWSWVVSYFEILSGVFGPRAWAFPRIQKSKWDTTYSWP